ncbi:general substrate transporter [Marasmius fiardii PR-910]|nr:general substrate transporter [Marasmius fiardii PR-910]
MSREDSLGSKQHSDVQRGPTAKDPRQRKAELEEAMKMDPGVEKWSWIAIQMYLITLVVCCCSGDSGFDGTVMGGINGMWQYQQYFGMTGVGSKTSIVFGIYTIGSLTGTIPAAYLPDRFGRRFSMFTANVVLIGGAVLTANATNKNMFLVGRWLTGMGAGCAGASAKSYLAEVTPPHTRGAYMGFLNSFYYVGQMAASGMMVATNKWNNDMAWRLPLYIQVVPAALNVLFIFFCPESPRWLISIGRDEDARRILAKFHSSTADPRSPVVDIEMEEIHEKIEVDGQDKRWWDFRPLFKTRSDRYRSYMCMLIGTFGQLSGNGLITYFLPILLKNAGIKSQERQQQLNFVNSVTSYIGGEMGSFTVDRFGRRKNLFWSTVTITIILAIVTGLLSSDGNAAQSNAGVTFIFLFMVVFSFGWTPMQALYPAEVLSYQARAKGLAFLNIYTQGSSCINTFGLPVALEKIKWKTYAIFTAWDVFECIVIWFFVVETKNLTLEEVGEIFEQSNPVQYSKELYCKALMRSDEERAR